jgi:hypothetical protein
MVVERTLMKRADGNPATLQFMRICATARRPEAEHSFQHQRGEAT